MFCVTVLLRSLRWDLLSVLCYRVVAQFKMGHTEFSVLPCCCAVYNFVHNNLLVSTSASYMRG